ncbi:hypothetical protein LCGC14_1699670 [marine sediment metagenome]|uniref:Abortive phage infection protein C-terminal domain-containing protein n=1 Tax=marine sediment metagenome TaxID=412755 RepID=A0A0F9JYY3_9ZZZZ
MAKNDAILIDGILDDRVAERLPSDRRDEAFEFFCFEQILRDADLSHDEIMAGSVDGRDDGGIDGFFILVNGHALDEPDSFTWPRSGCELEVWIITCKHHDTFRQAPLDNLVASLTELFDLSLASKDLQGAYSDALLRARARLAVAYRKLSPRLNRFAINFAYASRGDATQVGESVVARGKQSVAIAKDLFGTCDATFCFIGAAELVSIHRRVRTFSLELPFLEALARGERYILLTRLSDFHDFVIDENKKLRRYLFDSNVRAFMGLNPVNEDIRETLDDEDSPDFWWLNNGITILANTAAVTGKSIQLEGVQIVNGLQTTESIARYFADGNHDCADRSVLVKIIVSTDATVRDAIIRATNNQTSVAIASLHATDKIQRDIEDVLLRHGLFYERRANYYVNQGQPASHLVTPLYLAAGFVNLVLKSPSSAAKLRSRFMRTEDSYNRVFSEGTPLNSWARIARILKKTDAVLETVRPIGTRANERFLKNWRQITSFIATARLFDRFTFSAVDLDTLDLDALTDDLLRSSWDLVQAVGGERLKARRGGRAAFVLEVCQMSARQYNLAGIGGVEKNAHPSKRPIRPLTPSFIDRVNRALPQQPWSRGLDRTVATSLQCSRTMVQEAIQQLIDNGTRYSQRHGVVYGPDGEVIAVDDQRDAGSADQREG